MAQDERARAGSRAKVFPARALWTRRLSGLRSLAAMGCASRFSAPTMDYNKRQLLEPFATARMPTFCMMAGDETRKEKLHDLLKDDANFETRATTIAAITKECGNDVPSIETLAALPAAHRQGVINLDGKFTIKTETGEDKDVKTNLSHLTLFLNAVRKAEKLVSEGDGPEHLQLNAATPPTKRPKTGNIKLSVTADMLDQPDQLGHLLKILESHQTGRETDVPGATIAARLTERGLSGLTESWLSRLR